MSGRKRGIKLTTIHAQVPTNVEEVAEKLRDFFWYSGPHYVMVTGNFGSIKVYAKSGHECRRVISLLMKIAGIDYRTDIDIPYIQGVSKDPRLQQHRRFGLKIRDGLGFVSSRSGPAGMPDYPVVMNEARPVVDT